MKTESSDGRPSEVCVKKEETLELNIWSDGGDYDSTPEVLPIKKGDPDNKDYLCKSSGHADSWLCLWCSDLLPVEPHSVNYAAYCFPYWIYLPELH